MILDGEPHPRRSWRHLFSSRLQAADSFFRADAWIRKAAAAEALSWSQAWPVLEGLYKESETDPDPVLRGFGILTGTVGIREAQVEARLLRLRGHFRRTGEVLPLQDPFGGMLQTTVTDGRLQAWSRGPFAVGPASPNPSADGSKIFEVEVDR